MNSNERFNCVCQHKMPNRIPIDYLAHCSTDRKLKEYFGLQTEQELLEKLGCDFYYLSCRDISQNESCIPFYKGPSLDITQNERICPFGIKFRRGACNSKFNVDESISGPFENVTSPKEILEHRWPKPSWFDFSGLINECEANESKVIIGGLWSGILGDSYRMMGFQNFLLNIALNSELIRTLVNKMTDVYLELNDSMFSTLKGKMNVWLFGNDFGSQESLLISHNSFRDIFFENIKRLAAHAHSYNLKVMMHSCGSIYKIIPDLIEAGIDIIDPIQVSASGMDIRELKRNFGEEIVFHGGIDTQGILPNADINKVKEHCTKTITILGQNGGYIFAPSQLLGPDIPVENIAVMYELAQNVIS